MRERPGNLAILSLVLLALAFVGVGCGSKSTSSSSSTNGSTAAGSGATTTTPNVGRAPTLKFALHAGLAFGAFHRYIYKPFKAGSFTGGSLSRHKAAVVKAGVAGLFAFHELKLAVKDAQASPLLSKLLTPVNALAAKLRALGSKLKGGQVDAGSITSAETDIKGLSGKAGQAGVSITDHVPTAAQLAAG